MAQRADDKFWQAMDSDERKWHERFGRKRFNDCWELIDKTVALPMTTPRC